jgi:hypothetical protein
MPPISLASLFKYLSHAIRIPLKKACLLAAGRVRMQAFPQVFFNTQFTKNDMFCQFMAADNVFQHTESRN